MEDIELFKVQKNVRDFKKESIGFPGNQLSNLNGFYKWLTESDLCYLAMNNIGHPFSNTDSFPLSTLRIERKVIELLAPYYEINPSEVWGFVASSGSDGNNHGLYFGANKLKKETGILPIVYVSKEAHYSIRRLCDLQNLEVRLIDTNKNGSMDVNDLKNKLDPSRPALLVIAIGSTFLGAIDDQDEIYKVLEEVKPIKYYIHLDAALFGGYLIFTKYHEICSRKKHHFDSIAISGHKFFGIDEPCGIFIATKEIIEAQKQFNIEYLNNDMPLISCSRSALDPLKFYWVLKKVGFDNLKKQAEEILANTEYFQEEFDKINYPAWHNECSNTIFFKRVNDDLIKKYNLSCGTNEFYGGKLNHIVVMQHVNKEIIDSFINDLKESLKE